jgi:TRAP-type transport system periplasmic protein
MKCLRSAVLSTACLAIGMIATSVSAQNVNLRGAHIFPEAFVQSGVNLEEWAARVAERSGGRVTYNIVHGGALLSLGDHVDGIAAGLVDFTSFYPIYFPGEFRVEGALTNIIDIWSDEVPDLEGVALIHAQLHSEFEAFQAEYANRNMHMLLPLPADPYVIACNREVSSLDDLAGMKMRTFGRYFPVLQEALGVEPIVVPGPEAYQALATGLVDCVYSTPDWIHANSLHEVAPHVLIPGVERARPQLLATSVVAINTNSFERLPEDIL